MSEHTLPEREFMSIQAAWHWIDVNPEAIQELMDRGLVRWMKFDGVALIRKDDLTEWYETDAFKLTATLAPHCSDDLLGS